MTNEELKNLAFQAYADLPLVEAERDRLRASNAELLAALEAAEICVDELCFGQDQGNECHNILRAVRAAVASARSVK